MTIKLTFEFPDVPAALTFLSQVDPRQPGEDVVTMPIAPKRGRPAKVAAPTPTTSEQGSPAWAATLATSVAATPKVVNQPVQAVVQASKPVAPATSAPLPPPEPTATLDVVRAALREVFNTKGAQTATGILQQFGATRISDVKPEQYAAFIAACS